MKIIKGSILDASEQYIVHQCNCVTINSAGLALAIFQKYPYANVYSTRQNVSTPGSIEVRGNGNDQRYVIALFGQYYPGKHSYDAIEKYNDTFVFAKSSDSLVSREMYFQTGLRLISLIDGIKSVAFPWQIGCGLAGGDWVSYSNMIQNFAKNNPMIETSIYKLD